MIITSYFSSLGVPTTGLTPTIRIWLVEPTSNTLIIGSPSGTFSAFDLPMVELADGFYKFDFNTSVGYDPDKSFLVRSDGGNALSTSDRYQVINISPIDGVTNYTVSDQVWDEQRLDHTVSGSTGQALNGVVADVIQLRLDSIAILDLLELIIKYDANRTKIDKVAKTLTVYDNDGVTPYRVFDLRDSTGTPSITEICERIPQ